MHRSALRFPILVLAAGLTTGAALAEEPFGQERVETREFRTTQKLQSHDHGAGGQGHANGAHRHGRAHAGGAPDREHGGLIAMAAASTRPGMRTPRAPMTTSVTSPPAGAGTERRRATATTAAPTSGRRATIIGAERLTTTTDTGTCATTTVGRTRPGGRSHGHRHGQAGERGADPHGEGHRRGEQGHAGGAHGAGGHSHAGGGHDHGVETEHLFGFTQGSDLHGPGEGHVATENVAGVGRRGLYRSFNQKNEIHLGVTKDLNVAMAVLAGCHEIRNVPGFDDVRGRCAFAGFGGEVRYRFLDRASAPFGLTLLLEPGVARLDEVSGQSGRLLGSENRLMLDKELVPDTLFGAINLHYDVERFREFRSGEIERGSVAGISGALTHRISPTKFLGAEVRYFRAYEGLSLNRFAGEAVYVGPTWFSRIRPNLWVSAAWNVQVTGRAADDDGADRGGRRSRLDLTNFDRHQFWLKVAHEF